MWQQSLDNLALPVPESSTTETNQFLTAVNLIMNGSVRIFEKEITFKDRATKQNYFARLDEDFENSIQYGLVSEVQFFQRVSVPSLYLLCQSDNIVFTQTHNYKSCTTKKEQKEMKLYYDKIGSVDWHSLVILRHKMDLVIFDANFSLNDPKYSRIATIPFRSKLLEILHKLNINSNSKVNKFVASFVDTEENQCRRESCRFIISVCKTFENGHVNINNIPRLYYSPINW